MKFHAFEGYANTYNNEILKSFNPELQLQDTEYNIRNKLKDLLTELKGFKLFQDWFQSFKKCHDEKKYSTFYSS